MLEVDSVALAFGNKTVVSDVSFRLAKGDIGCLLGPSGCGKTSILRSIAGFLPIDSGEIKLANTCVASQQKMLSAQARKVGMVFQDYALFPHLDVTANIAFGLSKQDQNQAENRVMTCLEMVGLVDKKHAFPHQLSGGQQQRVAIARAMAPQPEILLLDEPFSSLDVALRDHLAADIRRIIKQQGITALLVTHDQKEAFAVADYIGVIGQGGLHQWGAANELYNTPATQFVAEFIGQGALYPSKAMGKTLLLRPEHIEISEQGDKKGKITARHFSGDHFVYHFELMNEQTPAKSKHFSCTGSLDKAYDVGDLICLHFHTNQAYAFSETGE